VLSAENTMLLADNTFLSAVNTMESAHNAMLSVDNYDINDMLTDNMLSVIFFLKTSHCPLFPTRLPRSM
jgi:hypothetical protein